MGERNHAELRYHTALDTGAVAADTAAIAAALREQLQRQRAQDLRRGLTHAGPHRDDLELRLGGRPLRVFGSAGQQRSGAMALRLLECETLREHLGCEPVLLLDDPFAELDPGRSARVLTLLTSNRRGQTVLAVPRPNDIPREWLSLARWRLRDGCLSDWSESDA
jgi:DNA replication and repair protein RecF